MLQPLYATRNAGDVIYARPLWGDRAMPQVGRRSFAQRLGLAYESKALAYLDQTIYHFIPHLPFMFEGSKDRGRAIPDGIFFTEDLKTVVVVEIKLRHTADGWFQLNKLYAPIVRHAFPNRRVKLVEMTKTYDPAVALPEPVVLIDDLMEWANALEGSTFGVFIWRP